MPQECIRLRTSLTTRGSKICIKWILATTVSWAFIWCTLPRWQLWQCLWSLAGVTKTSSPVVGHVPPLAKLAPNTERLSQFTCVNRNQMYVHHDIYNSLFIHPAISYGMHKLSSKCMFIVIYSFFIIIHTVVASNHGEILRVHIESSQSHFSEPN